jgi:DNA polymerase sigma
MPNLTKQQISRQDFVDNQIFELIQKLIPSSKRMNCDIEMIGAIRDALSRQIVDKKIMSEMKFYPYLKI